MSCEKPRVCVKKSKYRGKEGFLIYGHDLHGRKMSVFVDTEEKARRIQEDCKKTGGENVSKILLGK